MAELITQIYLPSKKKYLDLYTDIPLTFTFSISDYNELTNRKASFSKQLSIPGTKNNNAILNNIFDINTDDFNVNRKVNCQVICNFSTVFQGLIRLLKCNNLNGEISYDIILTDEFSGFFDALNNFGSLKNIDLYAYNHKYNYNSIIGKSGNTYQDVWVYHNLYVSGKFHKIEDFKPSIYLKAYTDRLFSMLGYTVECDLFESTMYKHLVIPPNTNTTTNDKDAIDSSGFKAVITAATPTIAISATTGNYPELNVIPFNSDIESNSGYDLNNLFNTTAYTYTSNKQLQIEFFLEFDVECYAHVNQASTYKGLYNGDINSSLIPTPVLFSHADIRINSSGNTYTLSYDDITNSVSLPRTLNAGENLITTKRINVSTSYNCNIGDKLFAAIGETIFNYNANSGYDFYHSNSDQSRQFLQMVYRIKPVNSSFKNKPAVTELVEGDVLNLNNFIPNITAKDLLSNIIKMFNLYIEVDKLTPNKLIIKTRDEFYKNGIIKDWTKKLDTSKTLVQSWLNENQPKTFELTYKQGSDKWNKKYDTSSLNQTKYGSVKYTFDNDYLVESNAKFESIFTPTPTILNLSKHIVPAIESNNISSELRLLYITPIISTRLWILTTKTQGNFISYTYNCATHFDDPYNPTLDINFYSPEFRFDGYNTVTRNCLSSLYWDSAMRMIMQGKLLTCYLTLNEIDIENLNFSDRLFIDGNYYILNRIIDYSPNSTDSTKVELIKLDSSADVVFDSEPTISNVQIQQSNFVNNSLIIGGYSNNQYAADLSNLLVGEENQIYANNSGILGNSNTVFAQQNNLIVGQSNFSNADFSLVVGINSKISGGTNNILLASDSNILNSSNSLSVGSSNTLNSANFSHVNGYRNMSNAEFSNIFGSENTVNTGATYATIHGRSNIANGKYSQAGGYSATTKNIGEFARSSAGNLGQISSNNYLGTTISHGATEIFIGGTERLIIPNNTAYYVKLSIVGIEYLSGYSVCILSDDILITNVNNNVTLIGTPTLTLKQYSPFFGACGAVVTADNTNKSMNLTIYGAETFLMKWNAKVEYVSVYM